MYSRHRLSASGMLLLLPLVLGACGGRAGGPEVGPSSSSTRARGSVLTAEQIENMRTTVNSMQELLLLLPGVTPAAGGSVQITSRGGQPLFVVDNVPLPDASAAMGLNPRDVDRVEVLREGGATAQYGFRGANGIILITMKR